MSDINQPQVIYIISGYTEAQKRASKKYYEKNKEKYIEKIKSNYEKNIEENRRKARERYHMLKKEKEKKKDVNQQ